MKRSTLALILAGILAIPSACWIGMEGGRLLRKFFTPSSQITTLPSQVYSDWTRFYGVGGLSLEKRGAREYRAVRDSDGLVCNVGGTLKSEDYVCFVTPRGNEMTYPWGQKKLIR